jgi:hypothetical protein
MEPNKWYIKEQCDRIRDHAECIEGMIPNKKIIEHIKKIIFMSYKIEADALGKDLCDLVE